MSRKQPCKNRQNQLIHVVEICMGLRMGIWLGDKIKGGIQVRSFEHVDFDCWTTEAKLL